MIIETAVQYTRTCDEKNNRALATKSELFVVEGALKSDIVAVKNELKKDIAEVKGEIKDLRYDSLKFIVWTGIAVIMALGGMMAHGFHWI